MSSFLGLLDDITHPLFALQAILVALTRVWLLDRRVQIPLDSSRVQGIDGLRGSRAGTVFIHHACIWYFFLRSGHWEKLESNFYSELGRASVALFFMITAFLFTRRLLASRTIEWNRLYVSRILRIVPLLVVHPLAALLVIAYINHLPTVFNGIDTDRKVLLTAAVSWTLDYEWIFYLMLPLLALLRGRRVPLVLLLISALMLVERQSEVLSENMLPFMGGVFAALLSNSDALRKFAPSRIASLLVLACLAAAYSVGRAADRYVAVAAHAGLNAHHQRQYALRPAEQPRVARIRRDHQQRLSTAWAGAVLRVPCHRGHPARAMLVTRRALGHGRAGHTPAGRAVPCQLVLDRAALPAACRCLVESPAALFR